MNAPRDEFSDILDKPEPEATVAPGVVRAVGKVMAILAKVGIQKDRKNEQQGYKFRGIDDVYNALAPALVEAGLLVIPCVLSRQCDERQTAKGTALFYVTVSARFRLISTADGSELTAGPFYGEAMDTGDKATNKAMSAAYKYWAMQTFAIPTDADNDADATTHGEIVAKLTPANRPITGKQVAQDALDGMSPEEQDFLRTHAAEIIRIHSEKPDELLPYIDTQHFDTEEKLALWVLLPSNVRSKIKELQRGGARA